MIEAHHLMDAAEVAEHLGISPSTLRVAISRPEVAGRIGRTLPPPLRKVGQYWVWRRSDIEAYAARAAAGRAGAASEVGMTATMAPDVETLDFGTADVARLLGLPMHVATRALATDRWGQHLDYSVRPTGSGSRARYTARDVVVMRMLADLGPAVTGPLRDRLAQTLRVVAWGAYVISATDGPVTVRYEPRWLTADEIGATS